MGSRNGSPPESDSSDWDVDMYKALYDSLLLTDSACSSSNTRVFTSTLSGSCVGNQKHIPFETESDFNGQKHKSSKVLRKHGCHSDNQLIRKDTNKALPSSFHHMPPSTRSFVSRRDVGSSQVNDCCGNPDYFSWVNNDVDTSNEHQIGVLRQSDPHSPGVGNKLDDDERMIYQVALRGLCHPVTEASLPDGLLSVPLFSHQKIALAWMLEKENSAACSGGILADDQGLGKTISMIALLQMQKFFSKPNLEDFCVSEGEDLNLDDDIVKAETHDEDKHVSSSSTAWDCRQKRNPKPAGGSLVVCPASVLTQWHQELFEKVSDQAKLDVLIYHGINRTNDADELAQYDVVLTTYPIVAKEASPKNSYEHDDNECGDDDDDGDNDQKNGDGGNMGCAFGNKKRKKLHGSKKRKKCINHVHKSTLAEVYWARVILDEAQTIKNCATQVSKACCALSAKTRWCLSGTPIHNSIDDLFSYFRFLKFKPYADYEYFCKHLKKPIVKNSTMGNLKLQAVLKAIMLRRTKDNVMDGKPIVNLPPKTIKLTAVDFSKEERAFYLKVEAEARARFKAYQAAGTVGQNYAYIFVMLLRLRQACDHPLLVNGFTSEAISQDSISMAKNLPEDMQANLLNIVQTLNICPLCSDPAGDAVVSMCGHVFCYQCVSEYLKGEDKTCPSPNCISQIGDDVVFTKSTLRSCICEDADHEAASKIDARSSDFQNDYVSSKIRTTMEIIHSNCRSKSSHSEGPIKALVFSQWTKMLDLVESSLQDHCIKYRRLDGSMSLALRDMAVKEFNSDPEVIVMLMSLKAGNVGLNMVAASHVILLDLWWNPATEAQAIDRVHRIGQTRPVVVWRLTITDTVEDRILALQEEKRKMVSSAFGEDQSGNSGPGLNVDDLKYLFMGAE